MTTGAKDRVPTRLEELTRQHPLRPIHGDDGLNEAQEMASRLAFLNHRTKDQDDYLEILAMLIEKYEEECHEIDISKLDPVDTLKFLLNENGMNAGDLEVILGNRSTGYAILNRDRCMSISIIRKLSKHFQVGADVFLSR